MTKRNRWCSVYMAECVSCRALESTVQAVSNLDVDKPFVLYGGPLASYHYSCYEITIDADCRVLGVGCSKLALNGRPVLEDPMLGADPEF